MYNGVGGGKPEEEFDVEKEFDEARRATIAGSETQKHSYEEWKDILPAKEDELTFKYDDGLPGTAKYRVIHHDDEREIEIELVSDYETTGRISNVIYDGEV